MNASTKSFSVKAAFASLALVFFGLTALAQSLSPLNLPLYFEANNDQTEFLSSGSGYQFLVSDAGVQINLRKSAAAPAIAHMRFIGANSRAQIQGTGKLPGEINYLIGSDSSQWQTGLPTFTGVQVTEIYPGINLIFHGNQRQLEYDFTIAPGVDPNTIKMRFEGAIKIFISPQGELVLRISDSEIRQPTPEIYQTVAGARKFIGGGYKILDARTVAFEVGDYDHSLPLVIDPVLGYSAFFGGNTSATGWAIARDANGFIYIAGNTFSKQFSTVGAVQTNFAGGVYNGDAFIAKFDSTGTNLIYLTYLGGSADDGAVGVAADSAGNAFVAGYTDSVNFPTNHALYPKIPTIYNGSFGFQPGSCFVSELNTNGTNLIFSTYLGGSSQNLAYSIAVDAADNAYVVGYTYSTNFPVTTNALQKTLQSTNGTVFLNPNAFVTEIASNDASLVYSTYLGGTNYDVAVSVAIDANNNVYVAGYTASFNFPVWNVPANLPNGRFLNGVTNQMNNFIYGPYAFDGFVTKFPPLSPTILPSTLTNAFYSTFLGGTNSDMAYGVAADASGNAYVTGWTSSTNFPVVNAPPGLPSFLTTNGIIAPPIATNVFLTKIAANGSQVLGSAVFGGNAVDIGYKVAVDAAGDAFVTGGESSTNFPTLNAFASLSPTNSGGYDAFVTGFSANWATNYYSVCIGGNQDDWGYGIVLDSSTNVYITGNTDSTNYPTLNASRFWFNGTNFINGTNYINGMTFSGTNDTFLTQITFTPAAPVGSGIQPTNQTVGIGATVTFSVTVSGTAQQLTYQWQTNGTNLVNGGRISGANSSTLTITNSTTTDSSSNYDVIVSYGSGSIVDSNAILTVNPTIYIVTPPTNETVFVGSNATFTVVASGSPLFYQWSTNGQATFLTNSSVFNGVTNSTLTVSNVQADYAGTYTIYVFNNITPFTSNSATLTVVGTPPQITTPPTNQTVGIGSTVTFTTAAIGSPPLFYQWQTNGINLTNGGQFSGAFTNILTITNVQTANSGTYSLIVSNAFGLAGTNAVLTVLSAPVFKIPPPNSNGKGLVFSGNGGTNGGTYYVLITSNLLTPLSLWTPILTNQFGSQGQFAFTNQVQTNLPVLFYILKQP